MTPYPVGQPANFTGAVGQFKLKASVDTDKVKANEAVTYYVELEGTGNLNMFSLPDLKFPDNMEVFPPTSSFEQEQLWDHFTGKMKWEYILISRQAGKVFLPRIEMAYFDPNDKIFHTISSRSVELNISPAKDNLVSSSTGFTKEEIALLGQDIHYNVTTPPTWIERGRRGIPVWVWTSYILAAGLFLAPVTMSRYQQQRIATAGQRMSHRALKRALNALKTQTGSDRVSGTVYSYLQERWQLRTDNLDPLYVEAELRGMIPPEELDDLIQLLKDLDAERYAPGAGGGNFSEKAKAILKKVDGHA